MDALADRIRECRSAMPELAPLAVDPALEAITATLDGEALFIRNELNQCRCLLYTSPSPRDGLLSRMPSSA